MSLYKTKQSDSPDKTNEEIKRKIKNDQERSSTFDRLAGFIHAIRVVLYILIIWSILTESGFLFPALLYSTGSKVLAIGIVALIIAVIEGVKLGGGTLVVKMFVQNWFKDGKHYWAFGALICIIVGTAFAGSIIFSVKGAPEIPKGIDRVSSAIELIDIDAIHAKYDARIAEQAATKETAAKMTWKGSIVNDGRKAILSAQAIIDQIETQRNQELDNVIAENDRRRTDHDTSLLHIGAWLGAFGGIGEGLTILFLILRGIYERNVYKELPDAPEVAVQKRAAAASQNRQSGGGSGGQQVNGDKVPPAVPPAPVSKAVPAVLNGSVPAPVPPVLNGRSPQSEQQNTVFASSAQTLPENSSKTVYLNDEHTIVHIGRDGTEKRYTRRDVSGMIRKYTKRLSEYEQRVQKKQGTKSTVKAIANVKGNLQYWNSRLQEFKLQPA